MLTESTFARSCLKLLLFSIQNFFQDGFKVAMSNKVSFSKLCQVRDVYMQHLYHHGMLPLLLHTEVCNKQILVVTEKSLDL